LAAHTSSARTVDTDGSATEGTARSPVGLWRAVFLLGDGPAKYDESFQAIHADGTEMMISNGLPPALGNVCVGAWKQEGATVRMKHMTWNWTSDGGFAGTFVMTVTLRVNRSGNRYTGRWSATNFDADGNHVPELDAAGTVHALRVAVH
jgi:hypothetical protein